MCVVIVSADNALRSPLFVVVVVVIVVVIMVVVVVVVARIIAIGLIKFPRLIVELSRKRKRRTTSSCLDVWQSCETRTRNESRGWTGFLETILATIRTCGNRLGHESGKRGGDFDGFSPRFSTKEREDRSRRSNGWDIDRQGFARKRLRREERRWTIFPGGTTHTGRDEGILAETWS